ncbi:nitroreductase family protein [Gordonia soli]|uniref:Putative nitroreductase n=1 Tax=Gordonia soli NBRC 108243 TaxID=1223545 RepID=M0QF90_9ACTN|nr:nitroreductase family protein [Gordonia soli]GAC67124.1 putative nitroreductase [Gordonia soli NBRC 108243]
MHRLIAERWSARGYDATADITTEDLDSILEAGRWAPTWGRVQPVRFVVGVRGDETFDGLVEALTRGNAGWAPASSALVLVCTADDPDDEKAHTYAAVDAGLAVGQMILQAESLGYNGHPMAGFDAAATIERFAIPADRRPLVLLGIGKLADPATVAAEIRERDEAPRERLPLSEIAFAGSWGHPLH